MTEATYAPDLKEWINQVLDEEPSNLLKNARVEISNDHKRADILAYGQQNQVLLFMVEMTGNGCTGR